MLGLWQIVDLGVARCLNAALTFRSISPSQTHKCPSCRAQSPRVRQDGHLEHMNRKKHRNKKKFAHPITKAQRIGLRLARHDKKTQRKAFKTSAIGIPNGQIGNSDGYAPPQRVFDDVCRWCKGSGFVAGLKGWDKCACKE